MAGLDFIPGLAEAETKFRDEQLEAFVGIEPSICGAFPVVPLTPQIYIELSGSGNAFFEGTRITPVDVAVFLWRVNPGFKAGDKKRRKKCNQYVSLLVFEDAVIDILEYIRRSLAPMPQWTSDGGSTSVAVWPSRLVDLFAAEYGWSEEYTLSRPFRRLWQYANRIMERKDDRYTHKCPEALRLRAKWLQDQNAAVLAGQN